MLVSSTIIILFPPGCGLGFRDIVEDWDYHYYDLDAVDLHCPDYHKYDDAATDVF